MRKSLFALLASLGMCRAVCAHDWSSQECREVAGFPNNAALSRDYGMSADQLLGQIRSDIELVRKFPPDLRWIVADAQDEVLLGQANFFEGALELNSGSHAIVRTKQCR